MLPHAISCQAIPGAADRMKFFKADLTEAESFDEAFKGCTYVVHCASPYILINGSAAEIRERLLKPAIQGTENVLGERAAWVSCLQSVIRGVV